MQYTFSAVTKYMYHFYSCPLYIIIYSKTSSYT